MSSDLLPESVNLFLDDFETSLCLPTLVVMVLCTAQFIFNRIIDIARGIYQSLKRPGAMIQANQKPVMDIFKGILTTLGIGKVAAANTNPMKNPSPICTHSREDEWDYCEEDIE